MAPVAKMNDTDLKKEKRKVTLSISWRLMIKLPQTSPNASSNEEEGHSHDTKESALIG